MASGVDDREPKRSPAQSPSWPSATGSGSSRPQAAPRRHHGPPAPLLAADRPPRARRPRRRQHLAVRHPAQRHSPGPLAQLPFHPNLFLLVTILVIFSGFFHELGHATATRYGGGSPGVMGVGIYLAWPAFYTDLTDSYRLDRAGPAAVRPRRRLLQRRPHRGRRRRLLRHRLRARWPSSSSCPRPWPCTSSCPSSAWTATTS